MTQNKAQKESQDIQKNEIKQDKEIKHQKKSQ
jgi:hypothetical protein